MVERPTPPRMPCPGAQGLTCPEIVQAIGPPLCGNGRSPSVPAHEDTPSRTHHDGLCGGTLHRSLVPVCSYESRVHPNAQDSLQVELGLLETLSGRLSTATRHDRTVAAELPSAGVLATSQRCGTTLSRDREKYGYLLSELCLGPSPPAISAG